MRPARFTLALTELLLISPALLFMTALFVRNVQPLEYEPAHTAQQIVNWYARSPRIGLWVLLIALPLSVLLTGCVTLFQRWRTDLELQQATRQTLLAIRAHWTALSIVLATAAAAGVLGIVALHMATD